jgi:peptide deformylase
MIREVLVEPNPILRRVMPDWTPFKLDGPTQKEIARILRDLTDTMFETGAVGFAANQIGEPWNICIVRTGDRGVLEFINPVIVRQKGKTFSAEGCLSIPKYVAIIPRAEEITVGFYTRANHARLMEIKDHEAIRAQHEIDHLHGVLIRDYVEGINGKKGGMDATTASIES